MFIRGEHIPHGDWQKVSAAEMLSEQWRGNPSNVVHGEGVYKNTQCLNVAKLQIYVQSSDQLLKCC